MYTLYDTLNPGNKYGGCHCINIMLHWSCCTAVRFTTDDGGPREVLQLMTQSHNS